MMILTGKQRLFVEAYLQCFNGVEAARRAGYQGSYSTLGVTAHDNLKNPKIRVFIEKRIKDVCMKTDEALALLAVQASFDPGPFLVIGSNGVGVDLEKLRDAGLTSCIKSITPVRDGTKIEFYDKQGAIDRILRVAGAYKDRVDVTSDDKPIRDLQAEILSAIRSVSAVKETKGAS